MNAVIYYSNTGESKRIAEYVAEKTGYRLKDISANRKYNYENTIIVFPVHCQQLPRRVTAFLERLQTKYLVAIATYGKMWHGNVLKEIQLNYNHTIIGAAYVPTKHTYLDEPRFENFERLTPLIDKIVTPSSITAVTIPDSRKNPAASIAPSWRSRKGVIIWCNASSCNGCGICNKACLEHAIKYGKTNRKCIRCGKCVSVCPTNALSIHLRFAMRVYLRKTKCSELIIYV